MGRGHCEAFRDYFFAVYLGRDSLTGMSYKLGVPQVNKVPFVIGDLVLVGVAGWILVGSEYQPVGWNLALMIACVGLGVVISVLPFLAEFRAECRRFDANAFHSTLEQIQQLEAVGELVQEATGQWRDVQEHCEAAVQSASEVAAKSQAETDRLIEITQKADTRERDHLRLEVEKQRRGEREWLEVLVGVMDHVFALHRAAVRSGQEKLIKQIDGFRAACLDICRRVGLSQYIVEPGEAFDPKIHKLLKGGEAPAGGVIAETLAPGFSYQGQPIRHPMVALVTGQQAMPEEAPTQESESEPEDSEDPDLFGNSS